MRHLLNTLFVLSEDAYLSYEDENIVILRDDEIAGRFPLHNLESILYFGYKGASPRLLGECADRGVDFCFFTRHGRFAARVCGESRGNILLRRTQYRAADDDELACDIAKNFIIGKIYNARWILERTTRDHPMQVDIDLLKRASSSLAESIKLVQVANDLDILRGLEGAAAQVYFSAFDLLILRDKDEFDFHGRNKRPPLDRVNALLSFAYTLLANDCAAALEGVGLDPYAGLMHKDRPGRKSLALDLMEELRGVVADRMVLSCINNRLISSDDFVIQENEAVYLSADGRKAFLGAWQLKKTETISHPFLGEKIPWGLVPHVQALLLARYLRGDLDAYPPFLWK